MQKSRCFLNPLFDKKFFLLACLILSCTALIYFSRVRIHSEGPLPAGVDDPSIRRIEGIANSGPMTPYRHGYISGFNAFLAQTDQPMIQVASYTSQQDQPMDEKEVERGYVDGYHRATEVQSCPRFIHQY